MKKIPLSGKNGKGKFVLVDDEDYERAMQYSWYFYCGKYAATSYREKGKNPKTLLMHRFILPPGSKIVDHINHNGLDNRKENLRICTYQENSRNQKSKVGSSKYKGVSFHKTQNKFFAYIRHNGKLMYLGRFDTQEMAAITYNAKAKELFGEFAFLNDVKC